MESGQGAALTTSLWAARVFAYADYQGMEFVVELQAKLRRVVGKCGIHQLLHLAIFPVAAG
jgi:hypothetical protein